MFGDREVVAFLASALAYGRVAQIVGSVSDVLKILGPSPLQFLLHTSQRSLFKALAGFSHRFATGKELAALLTGTRGVIERYGTLQAAFLEGYSVKDTNILPALSHFVRIVKTAAPANPGHLLPIPDRGSACKRLNLFLRWMVREDAVDPGGWDGVSTSQLIIPLDTHMQRLGMKIGFTKRKQSCMKAALDITKGFQSISPHDPVRYDFVLTRLGVWGNSDVLEK